MSAALPATATTPRRRNNGGIHSLDDLLARCVKQGLHWIWQGFTVRRRPSATLNSVVVHGPRITAVVMGREAERLPHQRWTVRCGQALCLAPGCLVLAQSHGDALRTGSRRGRLKRGPAACAAVSRAHQTRGTCYPDWMVQWAKDSDQPSREVGRALGVHDSTVRAWRSGSKRLRMSTGMFSQLLA